VPLQQPGDAVGLVAGVDKERLPGLGAAQDVAVRLNGPDRDRLQDHAASTSRPRADATDAATDACQRALELAPGSPEVHLALVRLYLATGSRDLAAEKLLLLGRLLDLGGTAADRARVAAVIRETFPGDPRFDTPA